MMRQGYLAMRHGIWEEFKERYRKEKKSSEWTLASFLPLPSKCGGDDNPTFVKFATTTVASGRRDLESVNEQFQQVLAAVLHHTDPASQLQQHLGIGNQHKAIRERQAAADGRLRQHSLLTAKEPTGLGRLVAQTCLSWNDEEVQAEAVRVADPQLLRFDKVVDASPDTQHVIRRM